MEGIALEKLNIKGWVTLYPFGKAFPEIPPGLPFSKGGELFGIRWRIPPTFSPFGKGEL
jgi:hypothetical protein